MWKTNGNAHFAHADLGKVSDNVVSEDAHVNIIGKKQGEGPQEGLYALELLMKTSFIGPLVRLSLLCPTSRM